jgi:UDP-N-acetylmuramate dehydrogenase
MNAGCYGFEVKDKLISVETVDLNGNVKTYLKSECNFEYRKNNLPKDLIFISSIFDGSEKKSKEEIEKKFKENLEKRKASQPTGVKTCGCTFKNPEGYSAWKLIKEAGFQGIEFNGAKMSEKHANFMVNFDTDRSSTLEKLGKEIQEKVKENTGINLEWEIQRIGEK